MQEKLVEVVENKSCRTKKNVIHIKYFIIEKRQLKVTKTVPQVHWK